MGSVGEVSGGVEVPAPTVVTSSTDRVLVVVFVVWVGHDLVGHVLLLVEQFLQADDGGEDQGELQHKTYLDLIDAREEATKDKINV